jgi:hypothetical protein
VRDEILYDVGHKLDELSENGIDLGVEHDASCEASRSAGSAAVEPSFIAFAITSPFVREANAPVHGPFGGDAECVPLRDAIQFYFTALQLLNNPEPDNELVAVRVDSAPDRAARAGQRS